MAWNPSPQVADCRELSKKWGYDQIIVLAIDSETGAFRITSYGKTKELCDGARKINDCLYNAIENGILEI